MRVAHLLQLEDGTSSIIYYTALPNGAMRFTASYSTIVREGTYTSVAMAMKIATSACEATDAEVAKKMCGLAKAQMIESTSRATQKLKDMAHPPDANVAQTLRARDPTPNSL